MKVLLIHNFYRSSAPSGEDIVYKHERKLLENNGLSIVAYEKFNDDLDDSSTIKRIKIALDGAWSKQTYQELSEFIIRTKPDIAHIHSIFPQISPSAYAACQDNGVPVIQTLHNFRPICPGALLMRDGIPCEDCIGTNLLPSLVHRCYRDSLLATGAIAWQITRNRMTDTYNKLVNKYITLTKFSKSRYVRAGFLEKKITVKSNFLPFTSFTVDEHVQPYAVFVGRLTPEKGVHTLLKAWKYIKNLPLKVIGDGELRQELEELVSSLQLPVEFLGFRSNTEVLDIVGNATLQIIPSECYEGFPMVVLEAYALGVPIVASRIGSLEEIITERETGLKFEPGNADDLAEKVNNLISDEQLLVTMKKNAQEVFKKHYTADANFKMLYSLYQQVIKENERKNNECC
ncbi:MAG: glycosyltransferase family 4 protein [Bacteroidetes bacterium]|nr:glycosyltransferase family 4 protein [Bacteroidota bacterium]